MRPHQINRFERCVRCGVTAEDIVRLGASECKGHATDDRHDIPGISISRDVPQNHVERLASRKPSKDLLAPTPPRQPT